MGARPSSFRKGGGFLDGVDLTIRDYQWTDEFNGEPYRAGKIKGNDGKLMDRPHSLNLFLTVRVDGADEDTTTTLKAANDYDAFEVDDSGHVLTSADGGECNIGSSSALGKFISTLCAAGFPEANFSDDPNSIDLSPIIGTRIRTVQRVDVERTKKFGQKVDKKDPQRKYDRKDLVVDQVYDLPTAQAKTNGKAKVAAKPNGKAEVPDLKTLAGTALVEMLESAGSPLLKTKLSVLSLKTPSLKGHAQRDEVREWLFNDDNLAELVEDGVIASYKKASKMITANEADE
jgi:hypothetical protein